MGDKLPWIILILFALSWPGIVLGWLAWDQDRRPQPVLNPGMRQAVVLVLMLATGLMTGASVLLLGGVRILLAAAAAALGGAALIYILARVQLRRF